MRESRADCAGKNVSRFCGESAQVDSAATCANLLLGERKQIGKQGIVPAGKTTRKEGFLRQVHKWKTDLRPSQTKF